MKPDLEHRQVCTIELIAEGHKESRSRYAHILNEEEGFG